MDLDMPAKIADLQTVILTLSALIVGLCAYIVRMPTTDTPDSTDPTCPIHKMPRSKCRPEWHE